MIKETCSCGATVEINFGSASSGREQDAIAAWRANHRHEAKITYLPPSYPPPFPTQVYGSGTATVGPNPTLFTINEDFVVGTDGEPVWIANYGPPPDWDEWASAFKRGWGSVE